MKVRISRHAYRRLSQRGGGERFTSDEVRRCLKGALRSGARCRKGAVTVRIPGGMAAVCVPSCGEWVVVTILRREKK